SNVDSYPITVTLVFNQADAVIRAGHATRVQTSALTVVADHKVKTYGDDNPALTAVVTGALNGDTINYTLATTALKYSNVASYPITVTLGSNPNYSVSKKNNTVSVGKALTSPVANQKAKTYGDDNPALTAV